MSRSPAEIATAAPRWRAAPGSTARAAVQVARGTRWAPRAWGSRTDSSASVRALPGQHDGDRAGENQEVEPQGPAVDVDEIQLDPLLIGAEAAAADLPQPGDSRFRREAAHFVATRELPEVAQED